MSRIFELVKFRENYGATKGVQVSQVEEPPGTPRRGAWIMDLEESASHQFSRLDCRVKCLKNLFGVMRSGHMYCVRRPRNAAPADNDRLAQTFGTVVPHSIVESTFW